MKKHVLINAALIAGTLAAGAGISWLVCQLNRPVVVAFNMKSTVDAFFDSAGRRSLDEAQTKALSDRFNATGGQPQGLAGPPSCPHPCRTCRGAGGAGYHA